MPYDPKIAAQKERNAAIFRETLRVIEAGAYDAPSGARVGLPSLRPMLDGAVCYHRELPQTTAQRLNSHTVVAVENNDCLVTAGRLVEEGYNPALLNFASASHPGGGVETGARAQEETICRRSTLARSLYTFDAHYAVKYHFEHREGNNYPLSNLNYSAIYSPLVTVFREGKECRFMEHPYQTGVITCAALNLNGKYSLKLTLDGQMPAEAVRITLNKIRTIFRVALLHGHDSLVLGAFGCGAFRNPPVTMASLFHQVLQEPEFIDRFRLVTFSIIEDHNSGNANLAAFANEFKAYRSPKINIEEYLRNGYITADDYRKTHKL